MKDLFRFLPSGWKWVSVGNVVNDLKSGLSRMLSSYDIGLPVLRSTNITQNGLDISDIKYWYVEDPQGADTSNYFLKKGDVLINFINSISQIGKTALYKGELNRDSIYTTNIMCLRTNNQITPEYFLALSKIQQYQYYVKAITKPAVNQASFTIKEYRKFRFPLPPITEQYKIIEILSKWDKAIELVSKRIKAKKKLKKGLMQRLLTGKVRFPGFDGEWRGVKLTEVAQVVMGQSPSSIAYNDKEKGLPLIQGNADIKDRKTAPRIYTSEITRRCKAGDIILSVRAPVGETSWSLHEACIGRGVCAIRAKKIDPKFLFYKLVLDEPRWNRYAQGSTFEAINSKDIRYLSISIPQSISEQSKISSVLNADDEEIALLKTYVVMLQHQKQGLMQKLLTGEVRVKV